MIYKSKLLSHTKLPLEKCSSLKSSLYNVHPVTSNQIFHSWGIQMHDLRDKETKTDTCDLMTKSNFKYSPEFELFTTRHSVPHAGPTERVHILHNDKWCLLQSHNGKVVLPLLCFRVQLKARPYVVPHRQRASLPLANLHE